jgi:acyl carrier protein
MGLPALSINWGPFAEVGLVARAGRGEQVALRGMGSIHPELGLAIMARLLAAGATQVGVMPFNLRQWRQSNPRSADLPFFAELIEEPESSSEEQNRSGPMQAALLAASGRERLKLLEAHVLEQIGQVMRLPADRINSTTPLQTLGMDSLMALELRNRLEMSLSLTLPATLVWAYPHAAALTAHLAERLQLTIEDGAGPTSAPDGAARATALERVTDLADDEVERLLAEKMAHAGRSR